MRQTLMLAVASVLLLAGCSASDNSAPQIQNDNADASYKDGVTVPTDDNVYTLKGTITGDVRSITRQTKPGGATINSPTCFGTSGCYGGGGGTVFGPTLQGKGYVRLLVSSVSPATDLASVGNLSLLKTTDTKAAALLPGDVVVFKCRRQYEALAASRVNETVDSQKKNEIATWELDFCRMATPLVNVPPQ